MKNYLVINGKVNGSSAEKTRHCYTYIFWEKTYWCSLSLRILYGTISSKYAATNWEVYKCTLLIMSNWLFILNWLYTKEQNVSDFHDINIICYTDGFFHYANWKNTFLCISLLLWESFKHHKCTENSMANIKCFKWHNRHIYAKEDTNYRLFLLSPSYFSWAFLPIK